MAEDAVPSWSSPKSRHSRSWLNQWALVPPPLSSTAFVPVCAPNGHSA